MNRYQYMLRKFHPAFPDWLFRAALVLIVFTVPLVPGLIYAGLRVPTIEFLNGMAWQPKPKVQGESLFFADGIAFRQPVAGTVPQGYRSYPLAGKLAADIADVALPNPLPPTKENVLRGQRVFQTYCLPCHGYKGYGDGGAVGVGRLDVPNSLHQDKIKQYKDGQIYHVIVSGQNKMPSYAKQIPHLDRWAAVLYVRVLQRSQDPSVQDLLDAGLEVPLTSQTMVLDQATTK